MNKTLKENNTVKNTIKTGKLGPVYALLFIVKRKTTKPHMKRYDTIIGLRRGFV